jgi:enterochelin esterase-like enzyme
MSLRSHRPPGEHWHGRHRRRPPVAGLLAALAVIVALVIYGVFGWLYLGTPAQRTSRDTASTLSSTSRPHAGSRPQAGYPPASLQKLTLSSPAIGGYKDTVYVVLPPGYAQHPLERYPVYYLLHGNPGKPYAFVKSGHIQDLMAKLIGEGKMNPMIIVMPSGGRTLTSAEQWANGPSRINQWETFVARDVVDAIDARYRTIDSAAGRAIAGVSEGGYGALNIGLHHPTEFAVIESWSGYMEPLELGPVFGMRRTLINYNTPMLTVRAVAAQLRAQGTYIWFYCGSKDSSYGENLQFDAELERLGIDHGFAPSLPVAHSLALWNYYFPDALIVASQHLA